MFQVNLSLIFKVCILQGNLNHIITSEKRQQHFLNVLLARAYTFHMTVLEANPQIQKTNHVQLSTKAVLCRNFTPATGGKSGESSQAKHFVLSSWTQLHSQKQDMTRKKTSQVPSSTIYESCRRRPSPRRCPRAACRAAPSGAQNGR